MSQSDSAVTLRARARLGATLKEKYKLERLLGTGGMATVYAATHRNTKRFAVKVLHPELSIHDDLRTRFLREGYIANSVGHPGAVAVLDDDIADDGAAFLVMELLEGETLDSLAQRLGGRLTPKLVLAMSAQALDVLSAAHARGIIHRDIKPENLFLTVGGEIKVLDFGVARLRDASPGTFTGFALGTPAYMAPEQALGRTEEIDGRTDLWALGATMFRLLSGRLVHETPTGQEAMIRAATCPAEPLVVVSPDLPPKVCRLVDKALSFARESRWSSAEAMREAVAEAYRALEGASIPPDALRSVASRILISLPPDGEVASDPCAPTALAPIPSPPRVPAQASDGAFATGLTGSASRRTIAAPVSSGGAWRFAAVACLCLGVGAIVGVFAKRGQPDPAPPYREIVREAAAPPPPPALVAPDPVPVPPDPAPVAPPASASVPPRPRPSGSAANKAVSRPPPAASASAKGRTYDDFDHQ
jgi:serine/threonine protein kinase